MFQHIFVQVFSLGGVSAVPSHPSLQSHRYLIKACKIKWALCKTYLNHFAPMIRAFGMRRANPDSNSPPLQHETLALGAIVPEFSHTLQTKDEEIIAAPTTSDTMFPQKESVLLGSLHHADPVRSGLAVPVRAVFNEFRLHPWFDLEAELPYAKLLCALSPYLTTS
ncbi:hypothetical protein B0H14DRAFT_3731150 [Mycena olivaceomarginata]|nr:hypothetical protein B0H14DRAFT_3731150 [Mycena olivaceomarginata]